MTNNSKLEVVLIFGAGSSGLHYYHANKDKYQILGFVDNDPSKTELTGMPVYLPSQIPTLSFSKIIIASVFCTSIYYQLVNELNLAEEKIDFFHPSINSLKDFKLVRPRTLEGLPKSLTGSDDDVAILKRTLLRIAERFMFDVNTNNLQLVQLLNTLNDEDFYRVWQRVTAEIVYDSQYSQIFFATLYRPDT